MHNPSITDLIRDTADRGMAELLLSVADYFYCLGAGIIPPPPSVTGRSELFATLECIHRIECLAPREQADPPVLADEIPGWLLALPREGKP